MTNAPANTARTGRHLGGRYLWLACHLCLGLGAHRRADGIDGSVSATQLASGEDRFPEAIPPVLRPPHPARRGGCGLRRSRLLCLLHVSFADHARRNRRARTLYQHRLGDLRLACLWSNLYGGKLADKGHGVEPLTHHSTDLLRAGRLPVSAGFRLAAGGWRHDPAASIRRTLTVLAESNRTRPVSCRYQLRGEPNQLV